MEYEARNYFAVLVYICETFSYGHEQMMALRQRVEKTFRTQPEVFAKRSKAPVTLNGIAITYGLLAGFGGLKDALKVSPERVVRLAREYDPFGELDADMQKLMHKRALANRRGRG